MLLTVLFLAATASPTLPGPSPSPQAVQSADLPAGAGAGQASIDAGLAAFKRHRFAQAEVDFRKAMEAAPETAAPYFYLGYTYYKMAEKKRPFHPDKQKAAAQFAKAYDLDPQFRPVWAGRK